MVVGVIPHMKRLQLRVSHHAGDGQNIFQILFLLQLYLKYKNIKLLRN